MRCSDRFSCGEARVTHEQNLVLPWVRSEDLPELWREARRLGLAQANIGLLSDMIACPGGDFCDLANARSLPIAQALLARYEDLDEQHDLEQVLVVHAPRLHIELQLDLRLAAQGQVDVGRVRHLERQVLHIQRVLHQRRLGLRLGQVGPDTSLMIRFEVVAPV